MNEFATPKPGSGGVNLRSKPVVDATTKVGGLVEGARIELEQAGIDWHSCRVYVSTQGAQVVNGFVVLRPEWFQINLRLAPVISDATDVGDLLTGQQLEAIAQQGEWLLARVYLAAQFVDLLSTSDPNPPNPPSPLPTTSLITPDELRALRLTPAQQRVPPGGFSQNHITAARVWNDYGGVIEPLAARVGIDVGQAVAVVAIESGGNGFGADGRMVIRFEVHLFWSQWGQNNPGAFNALFAFNSDVVWQGHKFRTNPGAPWREVHANQASEWEVFALAQSLNDRAAKLSISMGLAQVVGFNHKRIGYASVEAMFDALNSDERLHVLSLFSFIAADGNMVQALRQNDLVTFARGYNGPGQAQRYAELIAGVQAAFAGLVVQRALRRTLGGSLWSAALPKPLPAIKPAARRKAPSKKAKPQRKRRASKK